MKLKWIFVCTMFFSIMFSVSAYAATAKPSAAPTATPKPAPKQTFGDPYQENSGSVYDANARSYVYGTCTAPSQSNAPAYDVDATFSSSSVSYTYTVDLMQDYNVYKDYTWDDGTPSGRTFVSKGSKSTGTATRSGSSSCSVTVEKTGGSREAGEVTYKATATHEKGSSNTANGSDYWVTKVDVKVGTGGEGDNNSIGEHSYDDEPPKVPTCKKWYGTGGDLHESSCDTIPFGDDQGVEYNVQCYRYNDSSTSAADYSCTRSYHVKSMSITAGSNTVYTGIKSDYTCNATYYSWESTPKVVNVTSLDKTWYSIKTSGTMSSGTNYNFIGNLITPSDQHNARFYYTDPYNRVYNLSNSLRPISSNSFFSSDPTDGTYNIYCHYISKDYTPRFFSGTSNSSQYVDLSKQKTFKTVTHRGIKELRLSTSGCFNTGNTTTYTCTSAMSGNISGYLLPSQTSHFNASNREWTQGDFLTGNWYDFKAEIMYTDNTNGTGGGSGLWRDITDAPEVYWAYYPSYASANSYNTLMPRDGRDHRIPGDGMNTVRASFYNGVQNIGSYNRITTSANDFWAHQVSKIIIRGSGGNYVTYPKVGSVNASGNPAVEVDKTKINLNSTVQYTAWVVWSDQLTNPYGRGKVENWTNDLIWYGDDMVGKGTYTFARRGNQDFRTVKVSYADPNGNLYSASSRIYKNEWDYAYDDLAVYIEETCAPPYLAISQCQAPKTNELTYGFAQGGNLVIKSPWYTQGYPTLLPPSLAAKYGFSNWNKPNYPYSLFFTFEVTGSSNAVAER